MVVINSAPSIGVQIDASLCLDICILVARKQGDICMIGALLWIMLIWEAQDTTANSKASVVTPVLLYAASS